MSCAAQTGTYISCCLWVIFGWYFEVMHAAVEAGEREKAAVFSASLQRRVQKWWSLPQQAWILEPTVIKWRKTTKHWACVRDLQPCLLTLAAASDLHVSERHTERLGLDFPEELSLAIFINKIHHRFSPTAYTFFHIQHLSREKCATLSFTYAADSSFIIWFKER